MPRNTSKERNGAAEFLSVGERNRLEIPLLLAREEYRNGPNGGRAGIVDQLRLLDLLIPAMLGKETYSLLSPIRSLIEGLVALDRGHTESFLKASTIKGRPKINLQRGAMQGWLAATFKVLVDEGDTKENAVSAIALKLKDSGFIKRGDKQLNIRVLRSWQTKAIKTPNSAIWETYRLVLKTDLSNRKESRRQASLLLLERALKTGRIEDAS